MIVVEDFPVLGPLQAMGAMPLGEAQAARAVDGDEVVGVQEAEPLQAAAAQKRAHHERAQVLDARHDDPLQQVVQRIPVRQRVREGGLGVEDSADLLEILNEPPGPQQVLDVAPRARLDQKRQDAYQQQVLDGKGRTRCMGNLSFDIGPPRWDSL